MAEIDPKLFVIVLVATNGKIHEMRHPNDIISIQSISKIFTFAHGVIKNDLNDGATIIENKIGVDDAIGMKFNSIAAI